MDQSLRELYQEVILDHSRHPRHFGTLEHPTHKAEGYNPLCGDRVAVTLVLNQENRVADIKFTGKGCAISQASASMLTDEVIGKSLEELKHFDKQTVLDMLGIPLGPSRVKCALLPLKVMKASAYGMPEVLDEEED